VLFSDDARVNFIMNSSQQLEADAR